MESKWRAITKVEDRCSLNMVLTIALTIALNIASLDLLIKNLIAFHSTDLGIH